MSDRGPAGDALPAILVVDDDERVLEAARLSLRAAGHRHVLLARHGAEALGILEHRRVLLVLLDLNMPGMHGEQVLRATVARHPDVPVVVVTADYEVATIVSCMRAGAADYLVKPLTGEQLAATVQRALEHSALRYEAARLRAHFSEQRLDRPDAFGDIVTADPGMLRLFAYVEAISRGSHPVLILGETGTGKELIARALHAAGARGGPFVAVNVAGLDDGVFADTLFGHEPGAFTGATGTRVGMVERAGAGTLFLDEIGDLTESTQMKLLRLIQEREFYHLGSDAPRQLHARIVAATNRPPETLRPDLYYRLRSYEVRVPPLRQRLGDLSLLVERFIADAAADLGRPRPPVPPELYVHLANHDFPGNVRELQTMVFGAVAQHQHGMLPVAAFLDRAQPSRRPPDAEKVTFPFPMPQLRELEREAVAEAMRRVQDNQSAAARMLGVSRPTIARILRHRDDGG